MTTTPQKYKQTEIGSIPEDWEVIRLKEYTFITKLAGFEYTIHFNSYKDGGDIIVVRGTNITHNKLDLSDIKTIPKATSNKLLRSQLHKNDLVFAYVGTIGPVFLIEENDRFHLGPNTAKITVNKEIESKFLYHYFTSSFLKKEIIEHTSIGAQPSLSMSKIRSFKIILPPLPEQTAIATALNDADALITQLEKLIAKKRQIKQGAMQELLKPKEGWVVKKLGEEIDFQGGSQPPLSTFISSAKEGYIRLLQIRDYKTDKYETFIPTKLARKFCKKDDIMIGRYGPPLFQILRGLEGAYNVALIKAIPSNKVYKEFAYHFLKQDSLYSFIEKLSQRTGGQTGIDMEELKGYNFPLPSISEQIQIAQTLSDMDAEITGLEQKLDKYRKLKAGMMQNLLTGKIRLV